MKAGWCGLAFLAVLCVISSVEIRAAENETEAKVKVEILVDPPADCKRKSEKGDILKMNYRGTLASDGTEFDSRSVYTFLFF